jgi:hypothetical protein
MPRIIGEKPGIHFSLYYDHYTRFFTLQTLTLACEPFIILFWFKFADPE